jgi:hypothetical protein
MCVVCCCEWRRTKQKRRASEFELNAAAKKAALTHARKEPSLLRRKQRTERMKGKHTIHLVPSSYRRAPGIKLASLAFGHFLSHTHWQPPKREAKDDLAYPSKVTIE